MFEKVSLPLKCHSNFMGSHTCIIYIKCHSNFMGSHTCIVDLIVTQDRELSRSERRDGIEARGNEERENRED